MATTYRFAASPALAFEQGGKLHGFDGEGADYSTDRAQALYDALDVAREDCDGDTEYTLGSLPDGRWALVGATVEGHRFAIEASGQADDHAHGYTFGDWLDAAGRDDSASEHDLRAAWRAGEDPADYLIVVSS